MERDQIEQLVIDHGNGGYVRDPVAEIGRNAQVIALPAQLGDFCAAVLNQKGKIVGVGGQQTQRKMDDGH